jgi:hypothetical protein
LVSGQPGPPPPPPPPSAISNPQPNSPFANATRKSSTFQAKQKLKFVEWEKLNLINIGHTVWSHLDKPASSSSHKPSLPATSENTASPSTTAATAKSFENSLEYQLAKAGVFEDIEKTFAQKPAVQIKAPRKKEQVYIIDSKKAYTLSKIPTKKRALCVLTYDVVDIFMTSLGKRLPLDQIHSRVLEMDDSLDDEELLKALAKFAPTKEEVKKLTPYLDGSSDQVQALSSPDQFCLQVKGKKKKVANVGTDFFFE